MVQFLPLAALRTRWAAVGAAVAITLGAGGVGLVGATVSTGERATFVSITACRVVDVRPQFQVGPKASPLGPGETLTVMAHGNNGNCTGIPADAVALTLNVTSTDATAATFLTIWEDGKPRPLASSLNPAPGEPPTPNAVTTRLSPSGKFNIFNKAGSVNVFVDITGYFVDHNHDDRYYTKSQTNARILAASEVIATPGKFVPALVDENAFTAALSEDVTSTVTGPWLVSKTVRAYLACPSESAYFFLVVDGVPLPSSAIRTTNSTYDSYTLVGATTDAIPAGAHTVSVGADCPSETNAGNGVFFATAATVTVLE